MSVLPGTHQVMSPQVGQYISPSQRNKEASLRTLRCGVAEAGCDSLLRPRHLPFKLSQDAFLEVKICGLFLISFFGLQVHFLRLCDDDNFFLIIGSSFLARVKIACCILWSESSEGEVRNGRGAGDRGSSQDSVAYKEAFLPMGVEREVTGEGIWPR